VAPFFLTGLFLRACVVYITHLRKNWNYFVLFVSLLDTGIITFGLIGKRPEPSLDTDRAMDIQEEEGNG
jgi:hypothetical protein